RGVLRFAVLAPDNDYGATVVESLRRTAGSAGAALTRIELYDPEAADFSDVVRRLANYAQRRQSLLSQREELKSRGGEIAKSALRRLAKLQTIGDLPFDALLLADGGSRLQAIAALLPFYDIDPAKVHILGTGQWDEPGIGSEPALIGGWFAAPPPPSRAEFESQYRQVYGKKPPRLSTLAYDATALAATLARTKQANAKEAIVRDIFTEQALTAPSGYLGRDGIFRFRPDGVAERGLAVLKVEPKGFKTIDQAPQAFGPVMY
ncbi:MAG: penicillin-binding protein activator, partial [Rhodospirillales bacterium]